MQITISASLTDDQAIILAKMLWYDDNIYTITDDTTRPESYSNEINTQSHADFIKNVYENMIANDVSKQFIAYNDSIKQAEWEAEDQQIREAVISSISSSVE